MDGLSRVSGSNFEVAIGGKSYTLDAVNLGIIGEAENRIVARAAARMKLAAEEMRTAGQNELAAKLDADATNMFMRGKCDGEDITGYFSSGDGSAWLFWHLGHRHSGGPANKLDAYNILASATENERSELSEKIAASSGIFAAQSKNSQGPSDAAVIIPMKQPEPNGQGCI